MLEVFMQAFIPDARDALQEVNVLKQDTVAEVEREMQKKEENKSSPGCVMISARPQIDFVAFRMSLHTSWDAGQHTTKPAIQTHQGTAWP